MKLNTSKLVGLVAACSIWVAAKTVAYQVPDNPKVKIRLISKAIAPGSTVKGEVEITFAEGMHGYQNPPMRDYEIPVSISGDPKRGPAIKATYPLGVEIDFAGAKTLAYEGTVKIPFTFVASKKMGSNSFSITVTTQQCNSGNCFPPHNELVVTAYKVIRPSKPSATKN